MLTALPTLPLAAATDAASKAGTTAPTGLKAAVQAAAVRNAAAVLPSASPAAPKAQASASKASARATQAGSSKSGFFRTGPGAVVLGVMAVGTGYALYSASHDKISSPAKQ